MIRKLYSGMAIPYVNVNPMVTSYGSPITSTTTTKSATKDSDLHFIAEQLNKLSGALPSDIDALQAQIYRLYKSGPSLLNTAMSEAAEIQIIALMKKAEFNRKDYADAYDKINKAGGLGEFAISDRGLLFAVNDENDYKMFLVDDLFALDEYKPLTNAELLELRAHSPELAFNPTVLSIVKGGTGMKEVNEMILSIASNLGSSNISTEGFYDQKAKQGISLLQNAASLGLIDPSLDTLSVKGLYKNKLISESQAELIQAALQYIAYTLPENAKTLLHVKAKFAGVNIEDIILNLFTSRKSLKAIFETDIPKDLNESVNGDVNLAVAFLTDLGSETVIPINVGSSDTFYFTGYQYPIMTKDGKSVGSQATLQKISEESVFTGVLNFSLVSMGNKLIDDLSNVIVDDGTIYKTYLPLDQEAAAKGIIKPNLDYIYKLEAVRRIISLNNLTTPEAINSAYESCGLPKFINPNGEVNLEFYKPFAVMNGTAVSDAFTCKVEELQNNKYFEELTDQKAQTAFLTIKGKDTKEEFDSDDSLIEGDYLTIVKSLIYIPINLNPVMGTFSGGSKTTVDQLHELNNLYKDKERAKNINLQGQL